MDFTSKVTKMCELFLDDTMKLIETIVNEDEPEKSPVTARKRLQLCIDIANELKQDTYPSGIKELILSNGYAKEFYENFYQKLETELEHYHGETELK